MRLTAEWRDHSLDSSIEAIDSFER